MDAGTKLLYFSFAVRGVPGGDQERLVMAEQRISQYFLYEEPGSDVELDFLHVEKIPLRSGAHDWTIRPHLHPGHSQILLVTSGGGRLGVEDHEWGLAAPCLIVIPAGMVHEIAFEPGTDGFVATIASAFMTLATAGDARLIEVAARPFAGGIEGLTEFGDAFDHLLREFVWPAPGRRIAIRAHLQRILVGLLRLRGAGEEAPVAVDGARALVLRYRALVEAHFRVEKRLTFYAVELAVTPARLNAACRAAAGVPATRVLHDRMMVEAKRSLLYTGQSVAAVAHATGFEDPAYFSRFFTRRAGMSPGAYRARGGAAESAQR